MHAEFGSFDNHQTPLGEINGLAIRIHIMPIYHFASCICRKATTPSVRQHSRETLTSTTNSYFGYGHIHSSITKQESYDREKSMTSPPYSRLGGSPMPSGVSIGIKTDSVIDMPAENGTVVQTYFAGSKVAYNPQYNHHVPAQYSPKPQHMQLQLQTSFNDLQRQMESPSPPEKYIETPMSEKQFLSHSHNTLSVPGTNLSRSNPTVSTKNHCKSCVDNEWVSTSPCELALLTLNKLGVWIL